MHRGSRLELIWNLHSPGPLPPCWGSSAGGHSGPVPDPSLIFSNRDQSAYLVDELERSCPGLSAFSASSWGKLSSYRGATGTSMQMGTKEMGGVPHSPLALDMLNVDI